MKHSVTIYAKNIKNNDMKIIFDFIKEINYQVEGYGDGDIDKGWELLYKLSNKNGKKLIELLNKLNYDYQIHKNFLQTVIKKRIIA